MKPVFKEYIMNRDSHLTSFDLQSNRYTRRRISSCSKTSYEKFMELFVLNGTLFTFVKVEVIFELNHEEDILNVKKNDNVVHLITLYK